MPIGVECAVDAVRVEFELGPPVEGRDRTGPFLTIEEIVAVRWTVPLKPFVLVRVMVNIVDELLLIV